MTFSVLANNAPSQASPIATLIGWSSADLSSGLTLAGPRTAGSGGSLRDSGQAGFALERIVVDGIRGAVPGGPRGTGKWDLALFANDSGARRARLKARSGVLPANLAGTRLAS
jgi:hypothetical protein